MKEFEALRQQISAKKYSPVYFLYGEEPYFIDKLSDELEKSILNPAEKSFNQDIVYGHEVTGQKLLSMVRGFPMMASHRVVIVREAQKLKAEELEKLLPCFEKPVPTTVFVICWKGKGPDGRSKIAKTLAKHCLMMESKKLYDSQMPAWIQKTVKDFGLQIDNAASHLLYTCLGNNLTHIEKEIEKISLHLKNTGSTTISREILFDFINIDREFNTFELQNALGDRNTYQAHLILDNMVRNTKEHPGIMVVSQLFRYFTQLAKLKYAKVEKDGEIASLLRIHPFFAKDYQRAIKNFTYKKLQQNLAHLLEADLCLKGVRPTRMGEAHVLKTLIFNLLY